MESKIGILSIEGWTTTAAALRTMYPQTGFLATNEAMSLWYKLLQDIPDEVVERAADQYMAEEHFPPTVADIRKRCFASQAAQLPDWEQGWLNDWASRRCVSVRIRRVIESPFARSTANTLAGPERTCSCLIG